MSNLDIYCDPQSLQHASRIRSRQREEGQVLFPSGAGAGRAQGRSPVCRSRSGSCSNRSCGIATAGRSPKTMSDSSPPGSPIARRTRGDPLRRRPHPSPGLYRRTPAVRPRRHARRGAQDGQRPAHHRAPRSRRPGRRPLGPDRLLRRTRRPPKEHGNGVHTQPGALRVPEMGHERLQDLQGDPAGHRHLSPGQSGISRRAACTARMASIIPIPSSAPTATPP